jgi:RNA polymerase sigma-70 factor, ECF subfamily
MVEPMPTIAQTIARAKRGDRAAIGALYQAYVQRIYRYIAYRVDNEADVEDLTAEVFVKMVEGLATYRDSGAPFEAWLYRIASARIIDHRRRNTRRPVADLHEGLTNEEPAPEEHFEANEELATVREALGQLTEEQRAVLILRFVERKSHQDVADIIGKSVSAVKSIQHRTLIQLAALLGSEEKVRHYLRGQS